MKRGFTLIELLVVIAIIAILAGVVTVALGGTRIKARDARRQSDLEALKTAIEAYQDQKADPPLTGPSTGGAISGNIHSEQAAWNNLATELKPFLPRMPRDPRQGKSTKVNFYSAAGALSSTTTNAFRYNYNADSSGYELTGILENNPEAMRDDGGNSSKSYEIGQDLTYIGDAF